VLFAPARGAAEVGGMSCIHPITLWRNIYVARLVSSQYKYCATVFIFVCVACSQDDCATFSLQVVLNRSAFRQAPHLSLDDSRVDYDDLGEAIVTCIKFYFIR
jgi:hypothetical protein